MNNTQIKKLRLDMGLSQERFARHLGVSLQTVRRWETALTRPLPIIAKKLEDLQLESHRSTSESEDIPSRTTKDMSRAGMVQPGLGGLVKGVGSLLDLVSRMMEEQSDQQSLENPAFGNKTKGIYGFSIRIGPEGRPVVDPFGNIRNTDSGPMVIDTREPVVDIEDEGSHLLIILEVPGVAERDINIAAEGHVLRFKASSEERRYYKQVLLPSTVNPRSLKSSYRDGILEVSLLKQDN